MSNKIGINLSMKTRMARDKTSGLSKSFVQLSRDGKSADKSMGGLTRTLGGLKTAVSVVGIYKLTDALGKAVSAAADIRESVHMYNVAMGDFAESTSEAVFQLTELSGLDPIKTLDSVGEFNLLARSMGVTSDNSAVLSENINRLALDLSSLTNRDILKVQEDFKSGLLGRSRTVYKYGIDITEAALAQEALNQGISKSVRHMSQAEKMQLRYQIMIRTTGLAHGDFANTIETPANQMRIFSDRILTATRSLGTIFIPMLTKVMPYLNAFAKALNVVFQAIAKLVGYDASVNEGIKNTGDTFGEATGELEDGMLDAGKEANDTAKKIDKVKKKVQQLAGFDELNILGKHETPVTPTVPKKDKGKDEDDMGALSFDLPGYDSNIDGIKQKSDLLFESMMDWMKKVRDMAKPTTDALKKLWNEGLKELGQFSHHALRDFYDYFLVPVAKWVLGEDGLARLFTVINDMLLEIEWHRLNGYLVGLFKALVPFSIAVGTGLIDFFEYVIAPFTVWTFNDAVPRMIVAITDALNGIDWGDINEKLRLFFIEIGKAAIFVGDGLVRWFERFLVPLAAWTLGVGFPRFVEILTEGLQRIDWNKILNSFDNLWDSITPFAMQIGEGLLTFFEEVLVPLAAWVISDVLPVFLDAVAVAIRILGTVLEGAQPYIDFFWDNFIKPMVEFAGGAFIFFLERLVGALELVDKALDKYPFLTDIIVMFLGAWGLIKAKGLLDSVSSFGGLLDKLRDSTGLLSKVFSGNLIDNVESFSIWVLIAKDKVMEMGSSILVAKDYVVDFVKSMGEKTVETVVAFKDTLILAKDHAVDLVKALGKKAIEKVKTFGEGVAGAAKSMGEGVGKAFSFMTSPKGLMMIGIAVAIAGVIWLIKNWDKVQAAVKILKEKVDYYWNELKNKVQHHVDKVVDAVQSVIKWFKDLPKRAKEMKDDTIKRIKELKEDVVKWFDNMRKDAGDKVDAMIKFVKEMPGNMANEIRKFKNKLIDAISDWFDYIKDTTVGKKVTSMINTIRDLPGNMRDRIVSNKNKLVLAVSTWFDDVKKKSGEKVDEMIQKVKDMPGNMGDAIKSGAGKVKDAFVDLWDKVVEGIAVPVNKVIDGGNWILDKFGVSKENQMDPWTYAKGTDGHPGGPAMVNDQKGSTYRELVEFPDGTQIIPKGRNVVMPHMPRGTKVLPAEQTKNLQMYAGGVGNWIKDIWSGGKNMVKTGWSNLKGFGKKFWEYASNPGELVKGVVEKLVSYKGMGGVTKKMATGLVNNKAIPAMTDWATKKFSENEDKNPANTVSTEFGGIGFPSPPFRKTSGYGRRRHPIFGVGKMHHGIDLAAPTGTPVNAQRAGKVSHAGRAGGYGNMVKIAQGRAEQIYAHLSKILTNKGADVRAGQRIGLVGSTGNSTGPHLHYEMREGGSSINPGNPLYNPKSRPTGGGKIERWRSTVTQALRMNNLPTSGAYVNAWLRQIRTESGGNPRNVQSVRDINWRTGNLARGLVQVIPPTFNRYSFPGHKDPFNGLDSLLAGMNYAKSRYGTKGMLRAIGQGRGYAKGGFITGMTSFNVAGESGHEGIVPLEGRHMTPFADAVADRLSEHTQKAISNSNKGNDGNRGDIVIKFGERTIVDLVSSEINRKSRISGQTVINV